MTTARGKRRGTAGHPGPPTNHDLHPTPHTQQPTTQATGPTYHTPPGPQRQEKGDHQSHAPSQGSHNQPGTPPRGTRHHQQHKLEGVPIRTSNPLQHLIGREVFQPSIGRTRMINLQAELRWISKNLPLGLWAAPSGLGPLGRFLLTHPLLCWQVYSSW